MNIDYLRIFKFGSDQHIKQLTHLHFNKSKDNNVRN